MKQLLTITAVIVSLVGSAFAGPVSFKKTVVEPRPELYGLGWYGALQAGVNAYQNIKEPSFSGLGVDVNVDALSNVGGFGGGKLGYVFGRGKIRPALEADLFYNGFSGNYQVSAGGLPPPIPGGTADFGIGASVNSFAYLANFIFRFDLGRFQPYVGAGIGGYWASLNVNSGPFFLLGLAAPSLGNLDRNNVSWAWQIVAGADYYFTERVSIFAEYKYLTYMDFTYFSGFGPVGEIQNDLHQQLFAIGVRMHF